MRAGLHAAGLVPLPEYLFCAEKDNVEHAFFKCRRFAKERMLLEQKIGPLTPGGVVGRLLITKQYWDTVQEYAEGVVTSKELRAKTMLYPDLSDCVCCNTARWIRHSPDQ